MSQPEKHWAAPQVLFDPLNPNTFTAHNDNSEADEESAIALEMRLSLESSLIALADEDDEITEAEPLAEEEYILDEVADGEAALHARPARSSAFVPSFNLQNVVVACGLIVGCFALIWTRDLVSPSLEAQAKVHIDKQTAALQPANAPQPASQQSNNAPAPLAPVTQTLLPQTTTTTPQEVTASDEGRTETTEEHKATEVAAPPAASNSTTAPLQFASPAPQTPPVTNEPARIAAIPNRATASGNGMPFNPTASFSPAPPPVEGEPLAAPAPPDNHQLQSSPLYLNPTNNRPRRFPRRPPGANGQPQSNGPQNSAARRVPPQWMRPARDGQNGAPRQTPAQNNASAPTGH